MKNSTYSNKYFFFWALIFELDGTTSGPKSFKGPVGIEHSRNDLDEKDFVDLVRIESDLSDPEEFSMT